MIDNHPLRDAIIDHTGAGDHIIVPGVPDNTISVFTLFLVLDEDALLTFKHGVTPFDGAMSMLAHGSIVLDSESKAWFTTLPGEAFVINITAGGIRGKLQFTQCVKQGS